MFLPENIDLAYSEKYVLSIRLAPNGFSFFIHCPTDASVFHYQETSFGNKLSYEENIQKLVFDFNFFTQPFRETRVTVVTPDYTLVPDAFFDKKRANDFFDFNFHEKNGCVLSNALSEGEYHLVFSMDEQLHSFLSRSLWNPSFQHFTSRLLPFFKAYKAGTSDKRCFLYFHDSFFTIMVFSGENLLSANTFELTSQQDALYFIASVWEKLLLDQTVHPLYVCGNVSQQKNTMETLKKLVKYVEKVKITPKTTITPQQKETIPADILATL